MSSTHEDEFSASGSDEDEESGSIGELGAKGTEMKNQPYDEALDISGSSISVSEGHPSPKKVKELKNQPYDEALELSGSMQNEPSPDKRTIASKPATNPKGTSGSVKGRSSGESNAVKNKPYDEHEDLEGSDSSVDTNGATSPNKQSQQHHQPQQSKRDATSKSEEGPKISATHSDDKFKGGKAQAPSQAPQKDTKPLAKTQAKEPPKPVSSDEESSSGESESEAEQSTASATSNKQVSVKQPTPAQQPVPGGYNEKEYMNLNVSQEVKELFQYIGRFKPQDIELETRLKCFIPEYIPAVGEMDAFLKVPRPDGQPDNLGLKVLDEPGLNQSDATVLDLQLRAISKKKHGEIVVRSIDNAEKAPKDIDRWIKSIAELHCSKPPPQVHYTKSMPDIETLMQVWPEEFEELLGQVKLPSVDMDLSLEDYIRTICAVLDIPVYKNVFESLHVLFTLYLEFSSNQHFMNYEQANPSEATGEVDYSRK